MDKALYNAEKFTTDDIRAVDAKFEAQKIAFAPLAFQAIRTMIDLNILRTKVSRERLSPKKRAFRNTASECFAKWRSA